MNKTRVKLNPTTLKYEALPSPFQKWVWTVGKVIVTGITFGAFFFFTYSYWFSSPKGQALEREYQALLAQYRNMDKRLSSLNGSLERIAHKDTSIYRSLLGNILEKSPISQRIGVGGTDRYAPLKEIDVTGVVTKTVNKLDILSKQAELQEKSLNELLEVLQQKEHEARCLPIISPVNSRFMNRISSHFGWRRDPFTRRVRAHKGTDFSVPINTPVYATADGFISQAKVDYSRVSYGVRVVVDHGYGYQTLYGHLNKIVVKKGQKVKRGQLIAYSGNTGRSTNPHLHYEVRKGGKQVQPMHYIPASMSSVEYMEILKLAKQEDKKHTRSLVASN